MSKFTTKTEVLRHKIAREVFGEVDDGDGIREYSSWEIFEKCLEQQEKIQDLEHRLSNCIEPKFKVGDKCWYVYNKQQKIPFEFIVSDFSYYGYRKHKILYDSENSYEGVPECCLFSTLEEAEKNLKEMQNETTK